MAGGSAKADKTEQPTGKRQKDARKKGQVARSKDVTQVATLTAVLAVFTWWGGRMGLILRETLTEMMTRVGNDPLIEVGPLTVAGIVVSGGATLARVVGPIGLAVVVASVASQTAQGGWNFSADPLKLDIKKLSPAKGLSRLAPNKAWLDTLKTLILAIILVILFEQVIADRLSQSSYLARVHPIQAWLVGWQDGLLLIRRALLILVVAAVVDFVMQKRRHNQSLKMTKTEVKQERKEQDGNPETKSRVRRIQREMAISRMLADTATATVVVTNPTEYAVALTFDREVMVAPRVVALGRGLMARRIRGIAREHDVPIVENRSLAQALFRGTQVGDTIPATLFEAVAEVLAYLIRLKQLVL
jgi:flagellar biosynthetic protein FlhB